MLQYMGLSLFVSLLIPTLTSLAVTGYAIGWWRRVLEHQNPLYDGSDPEDDFTALRDPSDPHRQD